MSLQSLIQKNKEEFDKEFQSFFHDVEAYGTMESVRNFLTQAMTDTAKEMAEAVRLEEKKKPYQAGMTITLSGHNYNDAKSEVDEKISKFIGSVSVSESDH